MVNAAFRLSTLLVVLAYPSAVSACWNVNFEKQWGDGLWKSVSVGQDGTILAVSTSNDVYEWDSYDRLSGIDKFHFVQGGIEQVSVANKYNVYGINSNTKSIWKARYNDDTFTWKFEGFQGGITFKQVSVTTSNFCWATDTNQHPYAKDSAGVLKLLPNVNGRKDMIWVSTADSSETWAVGADNKIYKLSADSTYWRDHASNPSSIRLKQIHYSENDGYSNRENKKLFGTDTSDTVWYKQWSREGGRTKTHYNWYQICRKLKHVERGGDYLVGVDAAGDLWIANVGVGGFELEDIAANDGERGSNLIVLVVVVGCVVALLSCACVLFCVRKKKKDTAMTVEEDSDDDDDDSKDEDLEEEEEEVKAVEMEIETMAVITATEGAASQTAM